MPYLCKDSLMEKTLKIDSVVQTPNVDRIGRDCIVFRNAIMASPSCALSRVANRSFIILSLTLSTLALEAA
jgi:hypothetical protein